MVVYIIIIVNGSESEIVHVVSGVPYDFIIVPIVLTIIYIHVYTPHPSSLVAVVASQSCTLMT